MPPPISHDDETPLDTDRRRRMVDEQLRAREIKDERVLAAMARVPRQQFVDPGDRDRAYEDRALPVAQHQTISQPFIVALMTELARPRADARALDVGTGTGYQAAVLAELVAEVFTIEIVPELAASARQRLESLGYINIQYRNGDGSQGWPEAAPFDLIIAAAAPAEIPPALIDQLAPGGRLVIPVGEEKQRLVVIEKDAEDRPTRWEVSSVSFVPMTGAVITPSGLGA